ncbi:hypothetical protein Save01_06559 [Streptomyces avermitilis]
MGLTDRLRDWPVRSGSEWTRGRWAEPAGHPPSVAMRAPVVGREARDGRWENGCGRGWPGSGAPLPGES